MCWGVSEKQAEETGERGKRILRAERPAHIPRLRGAQERLRRVRHECP